MRPCKQLDLEERREIETWSLTKKGFKGRVMTQES